jgi:hypothetical protein
VTETSPSSHPWEAPLQHRLEPVSQTDGFTHYVLPLIIWAPYLCSRRFIDTDCHHTQNNISIMAVFDSGLHACSRKAKREFLSNL